MTPRPPEPLPAALDPLFVTTDALSLGVHPERLRAKDLDARVHGVRGPGGVAGTLLGLCRLFATRLPESVFFSHLTAAQLYGAPLPLTLTSSADVHVTVQSPARAPHAHGLRGHSRVVLPGDVSRFSGIQISSPTRLACELAGVLSLHDLVAVCDFLVHRRRPYCSIEELASRAERGDRLARSSRLHRAVALADDRSESPPESILRVVLTLAGIPPTACNLEVVTVGGRLWRVDLAYEHVKVAVEYQGAHHFTLAQGRRDMSRRSWLEADGWTVIEINSDDLADPDGIVTRVRAVLASRGA